MNKQELANWLATVSFGQGATYGGKLTTLEAWEGHYFNNFNLAELRDLYRSYSC